ncbi:hypothetical protein [Nocardioides sp.]|uniref:hypothetical protein n=1 Tax=Nocardioides sp. TaxID=35761 RepID=UPI00271D44AA|nr:hypothetical protein [Nocardioides sp.]MDO9457046.1 hypothetical protein [Nocardioides sp.]
MPRRAAPRSFSPARLAAGLAVLALSLGTVTAGPAATASADDTQSTASGTDAARARTASAISLVQANLYTGLSVPKFQADVRTVLSLGSDFVTYNEAHSRTDAVMAPAGYAIYRDTTNRYTAETPVVWRTDRWTAVAQGSWMISDWRGVPPGRQVELGRRYANWVTLAGVDGRQVSVVSVHFAPMVKGMPDLLRPSTKRLGLLVDKLATQGQVFIGGDLNIHYPGAKFPRDILEQHLVIPTYQALGAYFPTGDHRGATIDYVMGRGNGQLVTDQQYPVELNSDHDAVYGGWTWLTDVGSDVREVVSDPSGTKTAQRAAITTLATAVRRAKPGAAVRIATATLDSPQLARDLRGAVARGVHVQLVKVGPRLTQREKTLQRLVKNDGDASSWLVTCTKACRPKWRSAKLGALMMTSDTNGTWTTRYSSNRQLTSALLTQVSRITVTTGRFGIDEGRRIFASIFP